MGWGVCGYTPRSIYRLERPLGRLNRFFCGGGYVDS